MNTMSQLEKTYQYQAQIRDPEEKLQPKPGNFSTKEFEKQL